MTDEPLNRGSAELEARFQAYRAAHPAHQFVIGDASGIMAVIEERPVGPELVAHAADLPSLLDMVGAGGERMELTAYYADFRERFGRAPEFWKLERGQDFTEPGNESWKAFSRGDWKEALRLIEERRPEFIEYQRRNDVRGMSSRRVRVVALPPSPYLQWELRVLLLRDEHGHQARIVLDRDISDIEQSGALPDIATLDTEVMYQVIYDQNGAVDHAIRYTDRDLVTRCRELIAGLYDRGEPISEFFQREIAPLPPPQSPRT